MGSLHRSLNLHHVLIPLLITILPALISVAAQQNPTHCRTTCGTIPISYPFGIDDGCGSPYYRRLLLCSTTTSSTLHLRTPSGTYQIKSISYTDSPHLILGDPSMWNCNDGPNFRPTRPFSLDSSTRLTLSHHNDYLFFNCSPDRVIMEPKPVFCERFPDRCDSTCDTASYLCRHLPQCPYALSSSHARATSTSCCSYFPKATESLRLMLEYCATYASVYWRSSDQSGSSNYYGEVPEYGVRVDFDIPVTTSCLRCQDMRKGGGGTCGFDTVSHQFLCLCRQGNVTTSCDQQGHEQGSSRHSNAGVIAGTVGAVSAAGAVGVGAGVWYLNKIRAKAPVTCGVQSNENRLF